MQAPAHQGRRRSGEASSSRPAVFRSTCSSRSQSASSVRRRPAGKPSRWRPRPSAPLRSGASTCTPSAPTPRGRPDPPSRERGEGSEGEEPGVSETYLCGWVAPELTPLCAVRPAQGVLRSGRPLRLSPFEGLRLASSADPLLAALVDLLLPQGHGLLERVDRVLAGGEGVLRGAGRRRRSPRSPRRSRRPPPGA